MRPLYMIWLFHHKLLNVCVSTQCRRSLGLQCMVCCLVCFTLIVSLHEPQRNKHCICWKEVYGCQTCKWKFYCGTEDHVKIMKAVNKTQEDFWLEDRKDFDNAGFYLQTYQRPSRPLSPQTEDLRVDLFKHSTPPPTPSEEWECVEFKEKMSNC